MAAHTSTQALRSVTAKESGGRWRPTHAQAPGQQDRVVGAECVAIIAEMDWQSLPDEALVEKYRSAAGSSNAEQYLNELLRRHHTRVARWCFSFTGERESAADLAQEICVKACQNLASFKAQSRFSTWLYSIARNHCLNAVRSISRMPVMESDAALLASLPDPGFQNPESAFESKQLQEIARRMVIDNLEETERVVFTLHYSEELSLDAITRMLKLENASGAKAYLVSARRKLEKAVERWKARRQG